MSYSGRSESFVYLCFGSTAIRNSFTLNSAWIDFSRQSTDVYRLQILTTKVDPHTVRVNNSLHCILQDFKTIKGVYNLKKHFQKIVCAIF